MCSPAKLGKEDERTSPGTGLMKEEDKSPAILTDSCDFVLLLQIFEEEVSVAWCRFVGQGFVRGDIMYSKFTVVQFQSQSVSLRVIRSPVDMRARFQF